MTEASGERLYQLLPAIYRQRDEEAGGALQALLAVIEAEYQQLQVDLDASYDNWFIETCDDWVVPYIADLVAIQDLKDLQPPFFGQRRRVANALAYQRRKGLTPVLEHVIRDVTGWPAHVVEYAQRLARTQSVSSVTPVRGRAIDLRDRRALAVLDTPLDTSAHSVDVRRASDHKPRHLGAGGYNLDSLGIFLWRLRSYPLRNVAAGVPRQGSREASLRFTFHPLGHALPLFTDPGPIASLTEKVTALHLPQPISREVLAADLAEYRTRYGDADPAEQPLNSHFYGPERSLNIVQGGRHVPPLSIVSAALADAEGNWPEPSQLRHTSGVAVDPESGRILLLDGQPLAADDLDVSYAYAFSGEIGGGPYDRSPAGYRDAGKGPAPLLIEVAKYAEPDQVREKDGGPERPLRAATTNTLGEALALWAEACQRDRRCQCVVEVMDSHLYAEGKLEILLPSGGRLAIVAANGFRPVIEADILVHGGAPSAPEANQTPSADALLTPEAERPPSVGAPTAPQADQAPFAAGPTPEAPAVQQDRTLQLDGLMMDGRFEIAGLERGQISIEIRHCTLMPHGLIADVGDAEAAVLQLSIDHSITGPVRLAQGAAGRLGLVLMDSIVDGQTRGAALALADSSPASPPAIVERTTFLGAAHFGPLTMAQDVIFSHTLEAADPGASESSFIYVGSGDPRSLFTSTRYGDPAYGQLGVDCPLHVRNGASNGSEMGAFNHLNQFKRESNLQNILTEYLPVGIKAGILYVT